MNPGGRNDAGQRDRRRIHGRQLAAGTEQLFVLDIDEHDVVHGLDGGDQLARLSSTAATSAVARRAADAGAWPDARADR